MWRTVTNGIFLSGLVPGDRDALVTHLQDKLISEQTLTIPHPYTPKDADWFIGWTQTETQRVGAEPIWAIRDDKGTLLGVVGLHDVGPLIDAMNEGVREAKLGYWIGGPYRGRGIMTEVVRKACTVGFYELELDRIVADVKKGNEASERVLLKAGFRLDRELPAHYTRNGEALDGRRFVREP